jgi:hypothetical protein
VGIFVINKSYTLFEYLLAFCTMLGLTLFTLGDMTISTSLYSFGWNTSTGTLICICSEVTELFINSINNVPFPGGLLLVASILSEALMVNFQKKVFLLYNPSSIEMGLYTSCFGAILLFIGITCVTSEFYEVIHQLYSSERRLT